MTKSKRKRLSFTVENTQLKHADGVNRTIRRAFGVEPDEPCKDCIDRAAIESQLARFPEGQFVALLEDGETVAGIAATMRTTHPPAPDHAVPWKEMIGSVGIINHEPAGEWLYGVEMAVDPAYQGMGVGVGLYEARFALVKRLNLRGWYAGGMLMGYHLHREAMSVREYGERVIRRELHDPTVTMQMNRGFEAWGVIEDYIPEPDAGDAAVLIVWKNPDYTE